MLDEKSTDKISFAINAKKFKMIIIKYLTSKCCFKFI